MFPAPGWNLPPGAVGPTEPPGQGCVRFSSRENEPRLTRVPVLEGGFAHFDPG